MAIILEAQPSLTMAKGCYKVICAVSCHTQAIYSSDDKPLRMVINTAIHVLNFSHDYTQGGRVQRTI